MRHAKGYRRLNRTHEHRKALWANMSGSLIEHEQIKTTLPKAKELRRVIESDFFVLITIEIILGPFGKVAKGFCFWVYGIFEGADLYFIVISGIDQDYLWI